MNKSIKKYFFFLIFKNDQITGHSTVFFMMLRKFIVLLLFMTNTKTYLIKNLKKYFKNLTKQIDTKDTKQKRRESSNQQQSAKII